MAAFALTSDLPVDRPQVGTGLVSRFFDALHESRARAASRELLRHEALIRETTLFHAGVQGRSALPFVR